jgi:ribosomal protein L22
MSGNPEEREDELETPPADAPAAEEATDVVLEADDEAEGTAAEADGTAAEPEVEADGTEPQGETEEPGGPAPVAAPEPAVEAEPATAAEPAPAAPARARTRRRGAEKAEEPAPAPRRGRRERPAGPAPIVRAQAKYVRSSARKARLVCDHIRGKSVEEARAILAHTPRAVARDWSKLLESAVANAEHNHSLDGEDLYIKAVHADEGPTIKRFRPRAQGRATKIRKRTTHLTILLTPKEH